MSPEHQFKNFLATENFHLAFYRLQTASRNTYKELYYEDLKIFGLCLKENIENVQNEIRQKIFKPESSYKIFIPKKNNYEKIFIKNILKNQDCMVAMHGFYLSPFLPRSNDSDFSEYNTHIQCLASGEIINYISHVIKKEFDILNGSSFFNTTIWNISELYEELNISFRFFFEYKNMDPSKSLLNLNSFNNLVHDKICEVIGIPMPAEEYGVNLNSGCVESEFPFTCKYFTQINEHRNQKTEAHPYDKKGDLRVRITVPELKILINRQKMALEEICNFFHTRN